MKSKDQNQRLEEISETSALIKISIFSLLYRLRLMLSIFLRSSVFRLQTLNKCI